MKQKKHFYSHLIPTEPLEYELTSLDLEVNERDELQQMVEDNLHHAILEAILDELSEEDKKIFLEHIAHDAHEKVLIHLRGKIENIEDKIKHTADSVMEELHQEIREVKAEDDEESEA